MNPNQPNHEESGGIVAFRVSGNLKEATKAAAKAEGLSLSDIARRALMRDLAVLGKVSLPPHS
jgi:hypothetical protein